MQSKCSHLKHHFLNLSFYELTSPLHLLYRAFVAAAGAAYDSLNLSLLHYITLHKTIKLPQFNVCQTARHNMKQSQLLLPKLELGCIQALTKCLNLIKRGEINIILRVNHTKCQ